MGHHTSRKQFAILAVFAALFGAVAYRFRHPGVNAGSNWCPALVAVDFIPNHTAGLALRAGLPVYDNLRSYGGDFVDPVPDHEGIISRFGYPPPVAYLFAPLGWFSRSAAWGIWLSLAVAGMTLALTLLGRLAGLNTWFSLLFALALVLFYPLLFVLINGNIAVLCVTLLVIAIYFFVSGRSETLAALFLALATALKLYPGLFLLCFAVQRRWSLLLKTILFLAAIVVLTAHGGVYLTFLDRARRYDRFVQAWYANASLFSVLTLAGIPLPAANLAARLFAALVVGLVLFWLRWRPEGKLAMLYACAMVSAAMILAPNTMYDYNLIFIIPGLAAVLHDLRCGVAGGRGPLFLAALSYAAMAVPTHAAMGLPGLRGLDLPAASMLANKFPWLFLFFAAMSWRYLRLTRGFEPPPATRSRRATIGGAQSPGLPAPGRS